MVLWFLYALPFGAIVKGFILGVDMKTAIFKGYDEEGEIWAIGKAYGSGDTETKFICPIEPKKEIIDEYERRENVFSNSRKKTWLHWGINKKQ